MVVFIAFDILRTAVATVADSIENFGENFLRDFAFVVIKDLIVTKAHTCLGRSMTR